MVSKLIVLKSWQAPLQINMALTGEEENFVKVTKIVVDVIPKYLRKCFIAKWNDKYEMQYNKPWSSDNASGTFLFSEMPTAVQNNKKRAKEIEKLKEGDEQTWDTTTVVFALMEAGLNLIPGSRPKGKRKGQPLISEEIEVIRDVRNSFFGHVPNMSCSNTDFTAIVAKVKAVAQTLFGQDAEDEIENVVKSQIKSRLSVALQNQLDVEINRNRDFNELVCEIEKMKEEFHKMEGKVKKMKVEKDNLEKEMEGVFGNVQAQFGKVEGEVGNLNVKVEELTENLECSNLQMTEEFHKMEGKVKKMEVEQDKLENKVEGVVGNVEAKFGKVEGEVGNLNVKVEKLTENFPCPKLPPYTYKDIDELKERYKIQYQKHSINKVDRNGRIVMKAVKVQDFAVKVKISETRPAPPTFRDETRQHFELLKGMAGKDIELKELLNHDERVVLVCGVAGLGKTVLTKQLAFLWANDKIYTQLKLCIMMECRDINYFVANEGAALKRHELFSEFLKTKFGYDLRGGVSTLLIIDGIDELDGINSKDSVIWQLLDVKHAKYAQAKIILTGRPHVEGKLERNGKDIGGLYRCEIQGLSDDQIQDYVKKFASCKEDFEKIDSSIHSSKEHVKILSIPAFLNSMCCVTLLSDVQTVKNTAELYVWVLYLLLKEHVEKDRPSRKMCCEIFEEYANDLWVLCEICHQLLNENKIIIEGDIKSRLLKWGKGAEFIEGLFADISDCRTKKYQFKHLSIMEFLSAVHISRRKDRMEIIEHNLKTECYQVVILSCQLIGGYKYNGIIKDMFGNDEELKAINVEQFLPRVLDLVGQREQQHPHQIFQLSIDIIICFINKDVSNKNFIISTVKTLHYKMERLFQGSMRKVRELCGHLSSAFKCNEEDLKETFENVLVKEVHVDDVKSLTCVKYLPNVEKITLVGMKIKNSFRIRSEANAVAKCKNVSSSNCEFADDGIMENNMAINDHQLNELRIEACKLNKYSFINVCNWALASVNTFQLWRIHNIEHSWWGELVDAIQKAKEKNNGILALRELKIFLCTQKMSKEMQMKIVQCGVELRLDGKTLKPPSQSGDGIADVKESADDMIKLDLSTEKSNFVKVKKVLLNVVPKYLRQLFKEQWNRKYPDQEWDSSHASGILLFQKLSDRINSDTDFEKKLTTGNEQKWDAATLFFILLDSSLNLSTSLGTREDIKMLKDIESVFSADRSKVSMSSAEFIEYMDKIKSISRRIFNENAEKEVNDIENSPEERKMKIKLRQLLAKKKSRKRDTNQSDKILEKGYTAQIELRPVEVNFITIQDLLLSVILNHLRQFFKCRWDEKYPNRVWKSNSDSGEFLISKLSCQFKTTTANTEINKLKTGHETDWGVAKIATILLDSHLQLVTDSEEAREGIETLIEIQKSFNEYKESMKFSFDDFKYFAGNIMVASKKVFDKSADNEVSGILQKHEEQMKAVQLEKEVKDPVKYFESADEKVNFVKITKIVLDILPKYLRKCFIEQWNRKYSANQWNSDEASGQFLINELSNSVKTQAKRVGCLKELANGNEETWGINTLVFVMLLSDLDLIPKCREKNKRVRPLLISEEIDIIRDKINTAFAHARTMVCSSDEFRNTIADLQRVASSIFGKDSENEINGIAKSQMRMQMSKALNRRLMEEISIHRKVEQELKELEVIEEKSPAEHEKPTDDKPEAEAINHKSPADQGKPTDGQSELDINKVNGNLKKKYKSPGYYMHQIHKIESGEKIVKKDAHVNESAVQLTLSQDFKPEDTFKDENRRYFDQFIGVSRESVELTKLLDDRQRITFVRGVAGMGKTVLSKQLVWGWANDKMYTNFKLCIMFECRDLNFFVRTEGANLNKREQLQKYIVETFGCNLEGVDGVLFVVDGLDELFDIYEKDSIIWQLLFRKLKYSGARIILTGRPHVESKLEDDRVGDIRKVEIQGFTEKQINDYIRKFTVSEDEIEFIDRAKASSKGYLPIIHIPQFLNTFCCVAILSGGVGVDSTAELYSWVLMLLLNEHAGKEDSGKKPTCKAFQMYSPGLKELAAVCYDLLRDNKIIFQGDIQSKFGKSKDCLNFCESLFVDVSDNYAIKYQFKHLTLIEFLAALHICITENRMKIIEELLQKKYINAVVYTCELIARASCNVMIKNMLQSVTNVQNLDVKLTAIIELVDKCDLDEKIKFQRSLDILVSFLAKSGTENECILSSLSRLYCRPQFKSTMEDSNKLYKITHHLEEYSADKLHAAFKNIKVGEFIVNNEWTVLGAKYLGTLDIINFKDMQINLNTARTNLGKIGDRKCTLVWIEDCELDENEGECIDNGELNSDLDELVIWDSKLSNLNKNSFIILCDWGTSSKKFILDQVKFEEEWWMTLVEAMERKHSIGKLNMNELIVTRCTPSIEKEFQDRIVQSGIKLSIDDKVLYPTTPVTISPQVYPPQPTEIHPPEDTEDISSAQNSTNETHQERILHPVTEISSSPQESVQEVCREQLSQSASEIGIRISTKTPEASTERNHPGGAKDHSSAEVLAEGISNENSKTVTSKNSGDLANENRKCDSPNATKQRLLSELRNDYNFVQELESKLENASFNNLKDLLCVFELSSENRCKVLKSGTPCSAFFENLSKRKPKLSLQELRDDIENKLDNPNTMIFEKIDKDIKEGSVSFTLDSTLGELFAVPKDWLYILDTIAGDLTPEKDTLVISWENIASLHKYTADDITNFKRMARIQDESPLQKFLLLLCTNKPSLTVSEFVNKLREINREDAARMVERWRKCDMDQPGPPSQDSDTSYERKSIEVDSQIPKAAHNMSNDIPTPGDAKNPSLPEVSEQDTSQGNTLEPVRKVNQTLSSSTEKENHENPSVCPCPCCSVL